MLAVGPRVAIALCAVLAATGCGSSPEACDGGVTGHDEEAFPICTGVHTFLTCDSCHLPALGDDDTLNVSCLDCHSHERAQSDAQHQQVGQYQWDASRPQFCRYCHPSGR